MNEPKWVQCTSRQEIVQFNKDGTKTPAARCAHQACSRFNTALAPADCAACPLRTVSALRPGFGHAKIHKRDYPEPRIMEDRSLVYQRVDKKPPSVPAGYRRKSEDLSSDDAWVFIPDWPVCEDREMASTLQKCGCIKMDAMCASRACNRYGLPVTPDICAQCPLRRA